jgi:hypothetical protein
MRRAFKPSIDQTQQHPNTFLVLTDDQITGTENRVPTSKSDITTERVAFANVTSKDDSR